MKKMKKVIAAVLSLSIVLSVASCGTDTTTTPAATTAPAATQPGETTAATEPSTEPVTLSFSWWGGDTRHEATIEAVENFKKEYPYIDVKNSYGAWSGWEEKMATQFFSDSAPDVNQINWNWITAYSGDGSKFADLRQYPTIDLSQFDESALEQCTVADKLQGLPVSMTGRIFYWNKSTFEKAGIETPKTLEELYAAADTFKTKLGDDYYPLVVAEYDRIILMVYYLESKYGKAWVENNTLNYSVEEIVDGLNFITELETRGVTPTIKQITGDGANSLDGNPKWIEGKYAGIFEWDSSAVKFKGALADGQEFVVGDYLPDMGPNQGGFAKVALAFAISETAKAKEQCAMLIEYLTNNDDGTAVLASERGIPLSKKALANTNSKGLLDPLTLEANTKILEWVQFPLDPTFEDATLKTTSEGEYYKVFSGLSYGNITAEQGAEQLKKGIENVLAG